MIDVAEKILTWHPAGKAGVYIPRRDYQLITDFICSVLASQEISITELVTLGSSQLQDKLTGEISWSILVVKLDLEARGLITSVSKPVPYRSQFLKLRPRAVKKFMAGRPPLVS